MLSRPQARSSLERSGISWSPLWKCVRTFVYAFEPSPFSFWAEGSNEGPSTQHFRSNLHPIYQQSHMVGHLPFALPHSSLAPPRNPPGELFIAQPVADLFQPRVCALPLQIGERFQEWHILPQCRQCAEKQGLSPVLRQA